MWLYCIVLASLLVGCLCATNGTDCFEKEKSLGVLGFAKQSIDQAKYLFPNCSDDDFNNATGCGKKEKALAFLEIAKDLISEAEKTFPTCHDVKHPVVEPSTVEPTTVEPTTVESTTVESTTVESTTVESTTVESTTVESTTVESTTVQSTTVRPPDVKPPVIIKEKAMDCSDVLRLGYNTSDIYQVWPKLVNTSRLVYCDMDTDGGGWTVIQRRGYDLKTQDFYRDWETYKNGFGDLEGEFWLGNENIHVLSNQADYEVRFDLTDFEGNKRFAVYKNFRIENETNGYKLHAGSYSGDAGDSLSYENGYVFSTKDRQNGENFNGVPCIKLKEIGWWFNACNQANINGVPRKDSGRDQKNLYWRKWKEYASLASADMKLRRM